MADIEEQKAYGYNKKPLWQWIAIYVVIGVIIYAGIYFFFFSKKGGYSGYSYPTQAPQSQNTIILTSNGFAPVSITIKAGSTITWINKSGEIATINSDPHPIHTVYSRLNLGQFPDKAALILTFDKPGTYGYHNHLNPSQKGAIVVQ